jgi:hypothetical protein
MPYKDKELGKLKAKERYLKNIEQNKVKSAEYRAKNKNAINARAAIYREKNREVIKERDRASRNAKIDHYHAVEQAYREKNREKLREYQRYLSSTEEAKKAKSIANKKSREKHKDAIRIRHRAYEIRIAKELSDGYVSNGILMLNAEKKKLAKDLGIFDDLVAVARVNVLIKREVNKNTVPLTDEEKKLKKKELSREYYLQNKEYVLKKTRDYYLLNKERVLQRSKKYYQSKKINLNEDLKNEKRI